MARGDDRDASAGAGEEGGDRPQDPIVERVRPDPAQLPEATVRMSGFLGDSDRPGFRRLYFTRDLDYFAEFRVEDVLDMAAIPPVEHPFRGDEATRVTLRGDATVAYTRSRTAQPFDEFDIDLRLGDSAAWWSRGMGITDSCPHGCLTDSCEHGCGRTGECGFVTPGTCADTCQTCATNCGTCRTCENWWTCGPVRDCALVP